jgi:hypothetical protein
MNDLIRVSGFCRLHSNPKDCACANVIHFKIVTGDYKKYSKYKKIEILCQQQLKNEFPIVFACTEISKLLNDEQFLFVYSQ